MLRHVIVFDIFISNMTNIPTVVNGKHIDYDDIIMG